MASHSAKECSISLRVSIWSAGFVCLLGFAACTSTSGSSDGAWTAAYVAPFESVWTAALDVLEDSGYFVADTDRDKGRIRAESSARHAYQEVVLDVSFKQRGEVVRVNVQASRGPIDSPADFRRLETAVREFLADLDLRMKS
jgi:hypothetical protein